VVRQHPFWRRVKAAILAALKPHPAAMRDVADALDEVEGT
jgi:ParB-like chromosome segregation protein Spo0J